MDSEEDTRASTTARDQRGPWSIAALLKSGAIVPVVVIPVIAVAVVSVIVFIVSRAVRDGGLMPRPTALEVYNCKGFDIPFQMAFRHGKDVVQMRTPNLTVHGDLLNGKIAWEGLPGAVKQLGFTPPSEIVYDDSRSLHVIDGTLPVRTERVCELQP